MYHEREVVKTRVFSILIVTIAPSLSWLAYSWKMRVCFLWEEWIFLFATMSELDLGPTQPSFQLFSGEKWQGNEVNNPPSFKVMNVWNCTLVPHLLLHGAWFCSKTALLDFLPFYINRNLRNCWKIISCKILNLRRFENYCKASSICIIHCSIKVCIICNW